MKRVIGLVVVLLLVLSVMSEGWAASAGSPDKYPTRGIDLICPFAAGGTGDMAGRLIASFVSKKWGVPVNVVNKPGGNGVPALVELYSAKPDGYTLLLDSYAVASAIEVAVENLPFKVMDRSFIGTVCSNSSFIVVAANSPYKSIKDLVEDCRKNPGAFTWASLGGVGLQDIHMRKFIKLMGVDVTKTLPVMFKGGSEAITAIAGGHVKTGTASYAATVAIAKSGAVRLLANTTQREADFPDVPTLAELGYPIKDRNWAGISGPPKLPSAIIEQWERVFAEASKDPDFLAGMKKMGQTPFFLNSRAMREHVKEESEALAEDFGVKKK